LLSVTTTQFMRKVVFAVLLPKCRKSAASQRIALVNCVVAIAIGCANRVMQAILVSLLSTFYLVTTEVTG
jgi:hypothetical protein